MPIFSPEEEYNNWVSDLSLVLNALKTSLSSKRDDRKYEKLRGYYAALIQLPKNKIVEKEGHDLLNNIVGESTQLSETEIANFARQLLEKAKPFFTQQHTSEERDDHQSKVNTGAAGYNPNKPTQNIPQKKKQAASTILKKEQPLVIGLEPPVARENEQEKTWERLILEKIDILKSFFESTPAEAIRKQTDKDIKISKLIDLIANNFEGIQTKKAEAEPEAEEELVINPEEILEKTQAIAGLDRDLSDYICRIIADILTERTKEAVMKGKEELRKLAANYQNRYRYARKLAPDESIVDPLDQIRAMTIAIKAGQKEEAARILFHHLTQINIPMLFEWPQDRKTIYEALEALQQELKAYSHEGSQHSLGERKKELPPSADVHAPQNLDAQFSLIQWQKNINALIESLGGSIDQPISYPFPEVKELCDMLLQINSALKNSNRQNLVERTNALINKQPSPIFVAWLQQNNNYSAYLLVRVASELFLNIKPAEQERLLKENASLLSSSTSRSKPQKENGLPAIQTQWQTLQEMLLDLQGDWGSATAAKMKEISVKDLTGIPAMQLLNQIIDKTAKDDKLQAIFTSAQQLYTLIQPYLKLPTRGNIPANNQQVNQADLWAKWEALITLTKNVLELGIGIGGYNIPTILVRMRAITSEQLKLQDTGLDNLLKELEGFASSIAGTTDQLQIAVEDFKSNLWKATKSQGMHPDPMKAKEVVAPHISTKPRTSDEALEALKKLVSTEASDTKRKREQSEIQIWQEFEAELRKIKSDTIFSPESTQLYERIFKAAEKSIQDYQVWQQVMAKLMDQRPPTAQQMNPSTFEENWEHLLALILSLNSDGEKTEVIEKMQQVQEKGVSALKSVELTALLEKLGAIVNTEGNIDKSLLRNCQAYISRITQQTGHGAMWQWQQSAAGNNPGEKTSHRPPSPS